MAIFARLTDKKDYYHISNHNSHDLQIFRESADFERFLALLHIANRPGHFILRDTSAQEVFSLGHSGAFVDIHAYCLLPNSYCLVLSDRSPDGIRHFMHKVDTGYAMYFNRKYQHRGAIFSSNYRTTKMPDKSSLHELISNAHLYPFLGKDIERYGIIKKAKNMNASIRSDKNSIAKLHQAFDMKRAVDLASKYEYSSMRDYLGENRPQKALLTIL